MEASRGILTGPARNGVTFAEAAAEFLRYVEQDRRRKPSTLAGYRAIVRSQLLPAFGELPLERQLPRRQRSSAVLANLLNPKLTGFLCAFLPQFVPPNANHELSRLHVLSATFTAMTFIVFVIYGVGSAAMRRHLIDRPQVVQRVRRVFPASFVGLGIKLAATSR